MNGREGLPQSAKSMVQRLWGWKVAMHLFLVSLAAGIYLAGILPVFAGAASDFAPAFTMAVTAAAALLVAGMIFIFSHLGYKPNAWRAFVRVSSSWLARGSVIILAFLILVLIQAVILTTVNLPLGIVTSVFALAALIYSGMLLKALRSFAFWNTWLLPLLFVVSGISIGIMALAFLMSAYGPSAFKAAEQTFRPLFLFNNLAILVQAVVLGLYLSRSRSLSMNSFLIITRGHRAATFWAGAVAAGLIVPFILGIYLVSGPAAGPASHPVWVFTGTGIGIIGSYLLRYAILTAGTSIPLNVQGEMVPLPGDARLPASRRVRYHPD